MKSGKQLDELVQSVTLHKNLNVIFHGYVLPFILLYFGWMYFWLTYYDFQEFYEAGMIGFVIIGCLQIFCCLCCHWSVQIQSFMTCRNEPDPLKATVALVIPTSNNGSSELVRLHHTNSSLNTLNHNRETVDEFYNKKLQDDQTIWFNFQKIKYIWDSNRKTFSGLEFPVAGTYGEFLSKKGFQEETDVAEAEEMYGTNDMEMVVPEFGELFKERATAPFFVFQVFCVALWCLEKYWFYSLFTLLMLVLFECTLVQQQLRNMTEIRKMGNRAYTLLVYRSRRWRPLPSNKLLPGDLVSIGRAGSNDNLVPCDMLLLRGPCIVDESMLTGESVPQMKEPIEARDETEEFDLETDGRLHVLYGGTRVVQHTPPGKSAISTTGAPSRSTDNGCIAIVLRTGFSTFQGRLLRTILFGVKRVTANNRETFGFILFLLVFALAAAGYVWNRGIADPTRSRYRLLLECALILTSVIPPELPIELSLAVNTSLLALAKLGVYCTEPFRIPFAGKVDICCFDKTGTLTSDHLVVEGVALVNTSSAGQSTIVTPAAELPPSTIQVLATCHSLLQLDDGLVGDPLEKATLAAVDWTLTKGDAVIPRKGKMPAMKIFHRFHFTSQLKRMSVIAGHSAPGSTTDTIYVAAVKGAPEILRSRFNNLPAGYDDAYLELSRRGARVLALGRKELGVCTAHIIRTMTRDEIENDLTFVGLVVISCPLKPDSRSIIREIISASHRVVMITGDAPLTACHVARELAFVSRPSSHVLLTVNTQDDVGHEKWLWQSVDQSVELELLESGVNVTAGGKYELCITGDGMDYLLSTNPSLLKGLIPRIAVFARFAPKQKEFVINSLKALGHTTLMCGDGTNDVGALKHADVGVAILTSPAGNSRLKDVGLSVAAAGDQQVNDEVNTSTGNGRKRLRIGPRAELKARRAGAENVTNNALSNTTSDKLKNLIKELEEADTATLIRLGDASIASPFTSKLSSIQCICHVIKQGRCTLVTTLQMFKILALNALVLAYSQSVLYLDGVKLRDAQATLQGLLLAACFLFISRSQPLKTLSRQRPLPNIFNVYTVLTVLLQFAVHFICLIYLVFEAKARTPQAELEAAAAAAEAALTADPPPDDAEDTFTPNIINSTVFIISMALQIATFAINYRGQPYMESLLQNKALMYSVVCSGGVVLALALGLVPDLAAQFEIIDFPPDFRQILLLVLFADFFFSYLVDRICLWLCGEGKLKVY